MTETTLKNNGGFSFASQTISKKIKTTNLHRYGVEYPSQSNIVKNKVMNTNIERYGMYYLQTDEFKKRRKETNIRKYGKENPILDFSRRSRGRISKFQKEVYSNILLIDGMSKMEKEINSEITSDIYIPSKNLIVECYGDYWHCNPKKYSAEYFNKNLKMRAISKWRLDAVRINIIKNKGFDILIVWENDWKTNKEKVLKDLDGGVAPAVSKLK
jgi:G:T-mismatch repair DNA endonuclease (very short patch repair protein)